MRFFIAVLVAYSITLHSVVLRREYYKGIGLVDCTHGFTILSSYDIFSHHEKTVVRALIASNV